MATKAAFIYIAPENDYKVHKAFIDSPVVNLTVVGVKTYDEAEVITRELVADGITAIELCAGFGNEGVARLTKAAGGKAIVGVVRFDLHPAFNHQSGDRMFSITEKETTEVNKMNYRDKAIHCVKNTVLPMQRKQFEECGRCLDEQYKRYGNTPWLSAKTIEEGRVYEIGYPACICPDVASGKAKDASHCERSRQSVLYIIGELLPDKNISVEIIETVLGGAEKCRFKVTVE